MNITILCVGKIKEDFYKTGIEYYIKKIHSFCKISVIEAPDEKTPDNASDKEIIKIKEKEGKALLTHIPPITYLVALDIQGKMMDTQTLKQSLNGLTINGENDITFIIGGSLGLSSEILKGADLKLSFSKMTFPHQLMRVILLEQIYKVLKF